MPILKALTVKNDGCFENGSIFDRELRQSGPRNYFSGSITTITRTEFVAFQFLSNVHCKIVKKYQS